MSKLYLVTGGTGFLGQHLTRRLLERGDQVRILSRSADRALERLGATFTRGSVLQPPLLREALDGVHGVFHLAGKVERDPRRAHTLYTLHVTGTRNVLEAALETGAPPRLVLASTSGTVAVTRDGRTIPADDAPHATELVKDWPYYLSKVYAERAAASFAQRKHLDIIQMRPTLLLGPGDHRLSSTRDVLHFIEGRVPITPSGGLSFVDVRDAADAFLAAMDRGRPGASYLLGAANLTFAAFFERLEKISGVTRPRVAVPDAAARLGARLMGSALRAVGRDPQIDPTSVSMSQHFWYLDWSAAVRDLGFSPRDPAQTLYDTVQWLRANPRAGDATRDDDAPVATADRPFSPDRPWDERADLRHAAFSQPDADAYGQPHPASAHMGHSRITYDDYGAGPGLESLVGGALKGALGTVGNLLQSKPRTPSPAPRDDARDELEALLQGASPEDVEALLRLARRMKS
jgi:dihydroflavonol-4-reductase